MFSALSVVMLKSNAYVIVNVLPRMSNDIFAAMGITGFGKNTKRKQLDPARFEKNKREEVGFPCHFEP